MIKVAYKYNIAVTFKQAAQFWNGVFNVSILDVRGRTTCRFVDSPINRDRFRFSAGRKKTSGTTAGTLSIVKMLNVGQEGNRLSSN